MLNHHRDNSPRTVEDSPQFATFKWKPDSFLQRNVIVLRQRLLGGIPLAKAIGIIAPSSLKTCDYIPGFAMDLLSDQGQVPSPLVACFLFKW